MYPKFFSVLWGRVRGWGGGVCNYRGMIIVLLRHDFTAVSAPAFDPKALNVTKKSENTNDSHHMYVGDDKSFLR